MLGGNVIDSSTTHFGVRWFRIDSDDGPDLNGKYTKIQGVDLHHDQGALGAAINNDALLRQMTDHAVDGRQRVPDVAQPAVAGDARRSATSSAS